MGETNCKGSRRSNSGMRVVIVLLCWCFCYVNGNLIIGHRGDPKLCPENTLPSFKSAIEAQVDGVESDLRLTKDGVVVLLHDATLDRTTNCSGAVADWNYEDLVMNCQAKKMNPKGTCWKAGIRVPKFSQLLELLVNNTYVVVMDLKVGGIAKEISEVVIANQMEARVIASCRTNAEAVEMSQYLNITVKQRLGSPPPLKSYSKWLLAQRQAGFHALSVNYKTVLLKSSFSKDCQKAMMPLFYWTVDTAHEIEEATKVCASIITNVPRTAKNVIG